MRSSIPISRGQESDVRSLSTAHCLLPIRGFLASIRALRSAIAPADAVIAGLALALSGACAQPSSLHYARQIADLNPGIQGSYPTNLAVADGSLYFKAYTIPTGWELWRYDGTGIFLVKDINDTFQDLGGGVLEGNDSQPAGMTEFLHRVYFSAFDPRRGGELWVTDGTNTTRVADINPDANDTIKNEPKSSWPRELTALNGSLFFSANGGEVKNNYELWKYDGSQVIRAANIHPDSGTDGSSYPTGLTVFKDALFFMADDGTHGYELWKHDGIAASLLADINPGGSTSSSYPKDFTAMGDTLYFSAATDAFGYELWKTDGTAVSQVSDLNSGPDSSYPSNLKAFNGILYFSATDGTSGYQLWKHDGISCSMVSRINETGDSFPKNLTVFRGELYFSATDGLHGWELWRTDGTNVTMITDLNPAGDSYPESLTVINDMLYFVATTPATGYELWGYDGQSVSLVADINPGPGSSFPISLCVYNGELCFRAASDGVYNFELWALRSASLRFTGVATVGSDLKLSWSTLGGTTNLVQSASHPSGPYLDVSGPILAPGNGETELTYTHKTTLGDAGFYRIRVLP